MANVAPGEVLKLARVQTMALTALVPVMGALVFVADTSGIASGDLLELLTTLLPLFATGCMFHVFGFVLNEWADLEVDRASVDLTGKPIVSGAVPPGSALALAAVAAVLSFVPLAIISLDPAPHLALALAIALGAVYDLRGKLAPLDLVLAGSLSALLVAGAFASGAFDASASRHWALLGALIGLQFMQNLFQNAIEGGIKDADHDAAAGARTFASLLGVSVLEDGVLVQGRSFIASAVGMKAVHLSILAYVAVVLMDLGTGAEDLIMFVVLLSLSAGMIATMYPFLRRRTEFDRSRLKRLFSVHEMLTFMVVVVVFVPLYGPVTALVLITVPLAWFMLANALLYGRSLEPGV